MAGKDAAQDSTVPATARDGSRRGEEAVVAEAVMDHLQGLDCDTKGTLAELDRRGLDSGKVGLPSVWSWYR
jgi:hypothetical protein